MRQHIVPPKWINTLLRRVCKDDLIEEIEGDLMEYYELWTAEYGKKKANRMYCWHAIKFFRAYALKSIIPSSIKNPTIMLKNNFKIAWRNSLRNRGYASINILGLAFGFASSLLIYLWIASETGKDHQHEDSDQIYSVYSRSVYGEGGMSGQYNTPAMLPDELKKNFPEIELATGYATSFRLSLKGVTQETFEVGDITLKMSGTRGSPDFFKVFSFEILEGSADAALKDLHNITISRKMADVFFGNPQKAIGQTIRYQNEKDLTVAAVFEDIGDESSLKFDYLINWDAWVATDPIKQSWGHFGTQTYVKLTKGADPIETEAKIKDFLNNFMDHDDDFRRELGLQKFEDQYLHGNFSNGRPSGSRIAYVKVFRGIAFFILFIAIVNFINLATATATNRAKEVGIRKVVGAARLTLKAQFITESILLTFLSAVFSLMIVVLLLPVFNAVTLKTISIPYADPEFWMSIVGMVMAIGLVAGSYPAFVLSGIKLIPALKNASLNGSKSVVVRKSLVVFQFALSIILIVATLVVTWQTHYVRTKSLGFNKTNLLYIPLEGELISNYSLFRTEASKMPGIVKVDRSAQTPHDMGFSVPWLQWEGKGPNDQTQFTSSSVGFDFVSLMGLEIIKGRDFSRDRPVDENNFIINESTEKAIGFDDPLGKTVSIFGKEGKIVGVFKDFHYNSLHVPIGPMVLDVKEDLNFGTALVRIADGEQELALKNLQKVCEMVNPGYAFSYTFVDDAYNDLYKVESTMSTLIQYFAMLAILIACMGLFGLVSFATDQRVKEIGVRKVLGASLINILHLLSRQFIWLLVMALLVAVPMSYMMMEDWLNSFAYRIALEWWLFGLAALIALSISYLIIGTRVMKSAVSNPIDSLRDE